jgi:hypothetical protein
MFSISPGLNKRMAIPVLAIATALMPHSAQRLWHSPLPIGIIFWVLFIIFL